ncbi:MAG: tetratricopeptide repeat protein, partial [bacterium]|nr:tetratricopeptide repeat protein [bacterium]
MNRLRGPDRAPALVALGSILGNQLGEAERAMDCFKQALEDDPRSADAIEALLVIAAAREDWTLVATLNERRFDIAAGARKRAAISVDAGMLSLERLDDTQAARMWFDRALEMVEDDVTIYEGIADLERRTGDRAALATALERVIRIRGDDTPTSTLLEAADLRSEAGDEEQAVELLQRAQRHVPDDALVAETLSDSLARLGRTEELVEILEQRAAMVGDDPQAEGELRAEIGRVHVEDLDDPETAVSSFERAFELDPRMKGVASNLERLYSKREDWPALRRMLETAATEGPTAKRAHYNVSLGLVLERHFDECEGAVAAYETALESDRECQAAHEGISRIIHASGEPEALLRVCLREAEITSDRTRLAELVWKMVPLLEERDRGEEALHWVERLCELVPNDLKTLEAIVRMREALGRSDELLEPLERLDCVLTGSAQSANRRKLAQLHQSAGHSEDAIHWYQSALDGEPENLESLRSLKALYSETRDFDALARTTRKLADSLPQHEQYAELDELAALLVDQLGDVEGAIVVLWKLVRLPEDQRPQGVGERLEHLL